MLRISLGAVPMLQPANQATPGNTPTSWTTKLKSVLTATSAVSYNPSCSSGYVAHGPVCITQGCIDGLSACSVKDQRGNTCGFDQLYASSNAPNQFCPAPGATAPEETGVFVNPAAPGGVPIPGTQPMPGEGQATDPGANVVPSDQVQPVIVGINWMRVGVIAAGLALVGMVVAARRH